MERQMRMNITWHWRQFNDISGPEMHEILVERQRVFVVEQACAYQDADELDPHAWHLLGRGSSGALAAYARIVQPGKKHRMPALGRILTLKPFRSKGLGRQLVKTCIEKCTLEYPGMDIFISAQTYLINFYQGFEFTPTGSPYDDEGIEHIDMILGAQSRTPDRCRVEKNT